ncbi:hypothetical protein EGW08_007745 [Elysia chlorotica]|uniref:Uncharacterized protein n=1 Tax=Elysia chlorotica TaxID=188477 RepID=A0A433TSM7_ELYCH|nr:hypothetical protein EGW08_007745 [Elysia chlorotica]
MFGHSQHSTQACTWLAALHCERSAYNCSPSIVFLVPYMCHMKDSILSPGHVFGTQSNALAVNLAPLRIDQNSAILALDIMVARSCRSDQIGGGSDDLYIFARAWESQLTCSQFEVHKTNAHASPFERQIKYNYSHPLILYKEWPGDTSCSPAELAEKPLRQPVGHGASANPRRPGLRVENPPIPQPLCPPEVGPVRSTHAC